MTYLRFRLIDTARQTRTWALFCALLLPACSNAAAPTAAPDREARAAAAWIESRTDYTIRSLPEITTATRAEIAEASGGLIAYGTRETPRALYHDGRVWIWEKMVGDSRAGALVHELVHHAQVEAGMVCVGAMEYEAHMLHRAFMRERGHHDFGHDWDMENLRSERGKCGSR